MQRLLTDRLTDVNSFLNLIRPYCSSDKASFELSWTLRPENFERYGRLYCWIDTSTSSCYDVAELVLSDLGAPPQVVSAIRGFEDLLRVGVGIAITGNLYMLRLYLYGKKGPGLVNFYESWRWDQTGRVEKHTYNFRFYADVTDNAIQHYIPGLFAEAFVKMIADERFKHKSGYWIRTDENEITDNIYLALPWMPLVGQLPGINDILNSLRIPDNEREHIMNCPVKNFGYKTKKGVPEITIYTPADVYGAIPADEAKLQQLILKSATDASRLMQLVDEALNAPADLKKVNSDMSW